MSSKFLEMLQINVNDKLEKRKSNSGIELSYLSWSYAVAEFTKAYPDFKYEIKMFNNLPYTYDENTGYMVFTSITADNQTKDMWLPVMDSNNKAMKKEPYAYKTKSGEKIVASASMFDVNKAIMRCLVKNMAMFGLGLYVYNGEDLPEKIVEYITDEQITQIKELGVRIDDMCKYYGVANINEMTKEKAQEVINKKIAEAKNKKAKKESK